MKIKLLFLTFTLFLTFAPAFAADNYYELYDGAQMADFKLLKDIDPFQAQDYYDYAWAPYPLFRTCSTLIFKDISIEPGYYLLAARKMNGKDYVFFKEQGKVKHIIPVVKTETVPEFFYENIMPQPKKTKWQKFTTGVSDKFFKTAKNSKKQSPPNSFIQTSKIDNNITVVTLFYGELKYYMVFKTSLY